MTIIKQKSACLFGRSGIVFSINNPLFGISSRPEITLMRCVFWWWDKRRDLELISRVWLRRTGCQIRLSNPRNTHMNNTEASYHDCNVTSVLYYTVVLVELHIIYSVVDRLFVLWREDDPWEIQLRKNVHFGISTLGWSSTSWTRGNGQTKKLFGFGVGGMLPGGSGGSGAPLENFLNWVLENAIWVHWKT